MSVSGPADRPALRRWYEPPAWLLSFLATGLDAVWVHLLVVVTVGGYMGWWLVGQAWRGEGFAEGWWAIGGDVKSFEEL